MVAGTITATMLLQETAAAALVVAGEGLAAGYGACEEQQQQAMQPHPLAATCPATS
jgi:hypothetical protein